MFNRHKYVFYYEVPGRALRAKCIIKSRNKKAYLDGLRDAINSMRREHDAIVRADAKRGAQKNKKTNAKKGNK